MKKTLIFGLIAGAAAAVAAAVCLKKKRCDYYCCDDDFDDELECDDCCGDCCNCEEDCNDIPAEKAEEGVIVTDACVAYGNSEEEALNALDDEVESDQV